MKVLSALGADVLIAINPNGISKHGMIMSQTMEVAEETAVSGMSP
jgi:hypothetical protein